MIGAIALAIMGGFIGCVYLAIKPPPPTKLCGSPGGPPVTSPRVKLSDGRHLAYRETGISKEDAKYKIIVSLGFDCSKESPLPFSQDVVDELRVYFLYYDRAGYGESDPNPKRSVKSEAFDILELADKLQIGPKFYMIGVSLGAYPVWSCLNYIPDRLAGASLVVPFVNYWWPCLPSKLANEALKMLQLRDQWTFRIAHYTPWLFNWWMTQKWFPTLSIMEGNTAIYAPFDLEILKKLSETPTIGQGKTRQQGVYESLYRDVMAGFGKWEFDPMDINNPVPNNDGSVHIWQGYEDKIIPFEVNRYLSQKLQWIRYHEVHDVGHCLIHDNNLSEAILRELLLG